MHEIMTIAELWERRPDLHGQCVEFHFSDPHNAVRFSVCGRLRQWQREDRCHRIGQGKPDKSRVHFFTVGELSMEANVTVMQNTHAHATYFSITGARDDQTHSENPRSW